MFNLKKIVLSMILCLIVLGGYQLAKIPHKFLKTHIIIPNLFFIMMLSKVNNTFEIKNERRKKL